MNSADPKEYLAKREIPQLFEVRSTEGLLFLGVFSVVSRMCPLSSPCVMYQRNSTINPYCADQPVPIQHVISVLYQCQLLHCILSSDYVSTNVTM